VKLLARTVLLFAAITFGAPAANAQLDVGGLGSVDVGGGGASVNVGGSGGVDASVGGGSSGGVSASASAGGSGGATANATVGGTTSVATVGATAGGAGVGATVGGGNNPVTVTIDLGGNEVPVLQALNTLSALSPDALRGQFASFSDNERVALRRICRQVLSNPDAFAPGVAGICMISASL